MEKRSKPAKRGDVLTAKRSRWCEDVDNGSMLAAFKYLSLLMDIELAFSLSQQFGEGESMTYIKVCELLRAVELPILNRADAHVTHELVAISNDIKLHPVLCLRGDRKRKPIIVDGYYRACAAYYCDPDVEVPVKII